MAFVPCPFKIPVFLQFQIEPHFTLHATTLLENLIQIRNRRRLHFIQMSEPPRVLLFYQLIYYIPDIHLTNKPEPDSNMLHFSGENI
jgi:hypothetical protein